MTQSTHKNEQVSDLNWYIYNSTIITIVIHMIMAVIIVIIIIEKSFLVLTCHKKG